MTRTGKKNVKMRDKIRDYKILWYKVMGDINKNNNNYLITFS